MTIHYRAVTRHKGTPIIIGDVNCVLPPLSLLHIENFQKKFKDFDGNMQNSDNLTFFIDSVHAALTRNYPEATREDVAAGIGMEAMEEILGALVSTSGLVHRAEDNAEGEAPAGTIQN